jgi:hypothetical protein
LTSKFSKVAEAWGKQKGVGECIAYACLIFRTRELYDSDTIISLASDVLQLPDPKQFRFLGAYHSRADFFIQIHSHPVYYKPEQAVYHSTGHVHPLLLFALPHWAHP